MNVMGNHLATTPISLSPDLLKQSRGIVAAFLPAPLEIVVKVPYLAFSSNRRFAFGKSTGSQPAPHGLTLNAQFRADGTLCVAPLMQFHHTLITLQSAIAPLQFLSFRYRRTPLLFWRCRDCDRIELRFGGELKFRASFLQRPLDCGR